MPAQSQRLFESPLGKKPYRWQSEAIDAWEKAGRTGIVEAVTGSGKSFVAIAIAKRVIDEGGKCLLIVPSITLFRQWKEELEREAKGDIRSLVGAGYGFAFDPKERITLAVINSVTNHRYHRVFNSNFDLIVADECHRFGAPDFSKALLPKATMRLGLTATLERGDNGVDEFISPYFSSSKKRGKEREAVVFDYGFKEAIKDRVVSKFVATTLSTPLSEEERFEYDRCGKEMKKARDALVLEHGFPDGKEFYSELRKGNHSKDAGILISKFNSGLSDRRKILGGSAGKTLAAVKLSGLISASQGAIVYCADIKACDRMTSVLESQGIDAKAYHTKIDKESQAQTIRRFKNKQLKCVVAVNMLDEGIDIPHANLAIILSSSKQKRQLIQRLGRILRKKDDNSGAALVICYADETNEDPYQENEENDSGKLGVLNLAAYIHKTDLDDIDIDRISRILQKRVGWKG
ncbi:MAG: DEAD/DEAH box helicase [Ectothiorhodospiraceae bacterium AqS1]|nr:DEAD/DEAH box helicase [Ectothiorhodospiraceae bacterium AqS1]